MCEPASSPRPSPIAAALLVLFVPLAGGEELIEADGLRWWRGNMHTHSHWSDGDDYLESIALWYRQHGYDFLVFTDHNVLANTDRWVSVDETKGGRRAFDKLRARFPDWVETRGEGTGLAVRLRRFAEVAERFNRDGEFLLIQGEEISDSSQGKPIHLNASNVDELIEPQGGSTVFEAIQNNVRALEAQRQASGKPMVIHLNHPNFGFAVTAEDLMRVRGEKFFEVYNGHSGVNNSGDATHAGVERVWDVVLAHRLREFGLPVMYGLAVDDGHSYHDIPSPARSSEPGRGWVVVLAAELSSEALIESLESGRFYASSGVTLRRIATDGSSLTVEVEPEQGVEYTVEFVGTRRSTSLEGVTVLNDDGEPIHATKRYDPAVGETLATSAGPSATYRFANDELYVRARIVSSKPHTNPSEPGDFEMAWTQPVLPVGDRGAQTDTPE